ncbi:DUF6452 family protein [Marixanthomonas ophiurae]|uniref:DUF4625 domain-containing protein n=1 Tax=Marixanthomonas ophiurae TaxID=387659 RepID=A0A3E1Q7E1_9FLAO|nr:DUF6452 family protein [Marixanthomonas ophiurae]RFN58038.1 hypothetical protein DZ858_12410 [Marixanthomonas ophiurae]
MIKKICFAFLILLVFHGCTRDDICPDTTQTTPLLIVVFKNAAIPTEGKEVPGLTIETILENSEIVIDNATTDSIAIPLYAGADITTYKFTMNSQSELETPNTDMVTFNYSREDIYVNRACSFKTIYNNLEASFEDEEEDNWIFQINVTALNNIVENENDTHITILH